MAYMQSFRYSEAKENNGLDACNYGIPALHATLTDKSNLLV